MTRTVRQILIVLAALGALLLIPLQANAQAQNQGPGESQNQGQGQGQQGQGRDNPAVPEQASPYAFGQAAIDRVGDRLPDVAVANGLRALELEMMFRNDPTLAVDTDGGLVYFDELAPGEVVEAADPADAPVDGPAAAPPVVGPEFELASNPGAAKTIFLDFDGHVTEGSTWNSQNNIASIVSPPFDRDGDPNTWSAQELQIIADSWAVVAEDFAPWDVNVTTIDPGVDALRRSGAGDTQWGVRVLITSDNFLGCGCGGVAYIGSFDDSVDEPVFVFNGSFVGVSEAATHEVGHAMLLAHDGTNSGSSYYSGHSSAETPGWAPIMGAAYYEPVSQWSQQEFLDANNADAGANYSNGRDDVAILSSLTNGNGFGLRPDDHGDSALNATPIENAQPELAGLVGTRGDVDAFSFTTASGPASFTAAPAAIGPNLDIELTIRNAAGDIVATDNPSAELGASIDVVLAAGTYTVEVDGVGVGDPLAGSPTGYTDYASLGAYTLTGLIEGFGGDPDVDAPATPTGLAAAVDGDRVDLTWDANVEADLASYTVLRADDIAGPFEAIATVTEPAHSDVGLPVGTHVYAVAATDFSGNESAPSSTVSVITEPAPPTSVASSQTTVAGSLAGSIDATHEADGVTQTLTETESGGRRNRRHDLGEHRWTLPAVDGNQTLTIVATATDAGDADDGFAIEWSDDGGATWRPLTVVRAGAPVDDVFAIGGPVGPIDVRVIDTDRTQSNRSLDSVSVDQILRTGDGGPVVPVDPTDALVSIERSQASAGKGLKFGQATVTVVDDQGGPVAGATVTVQFTGDFTDTVIVTTGADGTAVARTADAIRKPSFDVCVAGVDAGGLTYVARSEAC